MKAANAQVLCGEIIEPVPPADIKTGFYGHYLIVPKKDGGLQPILDLRVLNRSQATIQDAHVE